MHRVADQWFASEDDDDLPIDDEKWESALEDLKERRKAREALMEFRTAEQKWERAGKWAEYYISGQRAADAEKFIPEDIPLIPDETEDPLLPDSLRWIRNVMDDDDSYLYQPVAYQDPEELTIARVKLSSDAPEEVFEAAQFALFKAREVVARFEEHLWSYKLLPGSYFYDPAAVSRIQKVREVLGEGRVEAVDLAQEWMSLLEHALERLEAETDDYDDPTAAFRIEKLRQGLAQGYLQIAELSQEPLDPPAEAPGRTEAKANEGRREESGEDKTTS